MARHLCVLELLGAGLTLGLRLLHQTFVATERTEPRNGSIGARGQTWISDVLPYALQTAGVGVVSAARFRACAVAEFVEGEIARGGAVAVHAQCFGRAARFRGGSEAIVSAWMACAYMVCL